MCNNDSQTNGANGNPTAPAMLDPATIPGFDTSGGFTALQRITNLFNRSSLVPKDFQGERNFCNCAIALEMALRMKANPLLVFQNLYIVQGRPAWSSQFLIATFNRSGRYSALRYEFEGKEGTDDWGCRATATELSTGKTLIGTLITIGTAKREGWYTKGGSKWQTMPEQMLRYRAAAWFIRAYAPEIAMGLYSEEEVRDTLPPDTASSTAAPTTATAADLNAALASTPTAAPAADPQKPTPRRGRPPKNATPKQEEVVDAEIVSAPEAAPEPMPMPTPEPVPTPQAAPVQTPEPAPQTERPITPRAERLRAAYVQKCRRAGVNPNAVRDRAVNLYPGVPMDEIHRMLVEDDSVFADCVGDNVF